MPVKRPCVVPGCPHLTEASRCDEHERGRRRRAERGRPSAAKRGYGPRHRRWRAMVLGRDRVCQDPFGVHGDDPPRATEADHITPIEEGGSRFSLQNGQGLCKSCHSRKTATEDGGFGR